MSEYIPDSRQQAREDKKKTKRRRSPNTDKMYGIYDPTYRVIYYFRTAFMRNRKLIEYRRSGKVSELAQKLSPKKY